MPIWTQMCRREQVQFLLMLLPCKTNFCHGCFDFLLERLKSRFLSALAKQWKNTFSIQISFKFSVLTGKHNLEWRGFCFYITKSAIATLNSSSIAIQQEKSLNNQLQNTNTDKQNISSADTGDARELCQKDKLELHVIWNQSS